MDEIQSKYLANTGKHQVSVPELPLTQGDKIC